MSKFHEYSDPFKTECLRVLSAASGFCIRRRCSILFLKLCEFRSSPSAVNISEGGGAVVYLRMGHAERNVTSRWRRQARHPNVILVAVPRLID